ncbi:MAG: hypothetical protein ACOVOW_10910 [Spirosomataceae bacterium]
MEVLCHHLMPFGLIVSKVKGTLNQDASQMINIKSQDTPKN